MVMNEDITQQVPKPDKMFCFYCGHPQPEWLSQLLSRLQAACNGLPQRVKLASKEKALQDRGEKVKEFL